MTVVLGVDGFAGRWVVVASDNDQVADAFVVDELSSLPEAGVVGIDMFVALGTSGPREVDRWCRRQVGKLSSSVFNAPPRSVVVDEDLDGYESARGAMDPAWPGMSRQTWGLVSKAREARALARQRPGKVFECHPEVCFARLAGEPLSYRKRTWAGQRQRMELLEGAGFDLTSIALPQIAECPVDDVLDAAVAALAASMFVRGTASLQPPSGGARVLAPD